MGLPNSSRETKLSGANGIMEIFSFPVQLTTSRIDSLTQLILTRAICDDHRYIYIVKDISQGDAKNNILYN